MGFTADTAITNDDDFEKILAIQDIKALNRGAGNWDNLHKEAVNHIIRKLSIIGDPSDCTNETIFREYAVTWVAGRIFRQHALDGGDEISTSKAVFFVEELRDLWKEAIGAAIFDTDDDSIGDTRIGASTPEVLNLNSGGRFSPGQGRRIKYNPSLTGFSDGVKDAD